MTDARYYVVGDHDVWMIKFKDGENGLCGRGDKSFVFAVDAAQKLGIVVKYVDQWHQLSDLARCNQKR